MGCSYYCLHAAFLIGLVQPRRLHEGRPTTPCTLCVPTASIALFAQEMSVVRLPVWPLAATMLSFGLPAAADQLISFTDNTLDQATLGSLSDTQANWAVEWTQAVATTDVTVRAILGAVSGATGNWWITTALGPATTPADIVALASTPRRA